MSQPLKTFLKYALSIGLTLLFLYFAFKGTDFEDLWRILSRANYWWALAMIPPLFISHLLRTWRWEYMMRPIKQGMKFHNLFSALIVGYMLNNVLPRAGELARPYAIGKLEGVSRSAALGTVLVERLFDMLSFLLVIALVPLLYSGPLTQVFPWLESAGIWITVVTVSVLVLFTFLMLRRDVVVWLLNFVTRRLSPKHARLVEHIAHSFLDGFLFIKETKNYFMIGVLSILIWLFYIPMMYFPFFSFGLYNLGWDAARTTTSLFRHLPSSTVWVTRLPAATQPLRTLSATSQRLLLEFTSCFVTSCISQRSRNRILSIRELWEI
jgi:uncharacterized protein (TIRG00374 family)